MVSTVATPIPNQPITRDRMSGAPTPTNPMEAMEAMKAWAEQMQKSMQAQQQSMQQQMAAMQQQMTTMVQAATQEQNTAPPMSGSLKPNKPSTFNGAARSVEAWLFELENYFTLTPATEQQKVAFAVSCLREGAITWWKAVTAGMDVAAKNQLDFEAFKTMVQTNFNPVGAAVASRAALHRIKQTNSVQAYNGAFLNHLNAIAHKMEEDDKMFLYTQGLQPHIAREVQMHRPKNLHECMHLAQRAETDQRQWRFNGRPGGNASRYSPMAMQSGAVPMEVAMMADEPTNVSYGSNGQWVYVDAAGDEQPTEVKQTKNNEQVSVNAVNLNRAPMRSSLTEQQRQECMKKGLCFYCQKQGHLSRTCPSKPKNGQRQQA